MTMNVPTSGWSNKNGTSGRQCGCTTWKQHWINFNPSKMNWPVICFIEGCKNTPTLGAHVINSRVSGEYIIPACDACNKRSDSFTLRTGLSLVSANKSKTCQ
jgi:hypothetical protein